MSKKTFFLAAILFLGMRSFALDLGVIAGSITQPSSFSYGLSVGSGTVVPMLKFEFEGCRIKVTGTNSLSAAVALRPTFGKLAPYAVLGAGSEFEKLNFRFSEYEFHTFIGGGVHLFLNSMLSLRFDLRFLHFAEVNKTRFSGGVFLHL